MSLEDKIEKRVRIACILTLVSLALMTYSLLVPKPLPVIVAMSLGQVVGTASLAFYIYAILADFQRARMLRRAEREAAKSMAGKTEG